MSLFKGPLVAKSIVAIRAMTCLSDDQIVKKAVAMTMDELASQVETTAA
jgi:hypothetical protein